PAAESDRLALGRHQWRPERGVRSVSLLGFGQLMLVATRSASPQAGDIRVTFAARGALQALVIRQLLPDPRTPLGARGDRHLDTARRTGAADRLGLTRLRVTRGAGTCRLTTGGRRVRVARSSPAGLRVRRTWRVKESTPPCQ